MLREADAAPVGSEGAIQPVPFSMKPAPAATFRKGRQDRVIAASAKHYNELHKPDAFECVLANGQVGWCVLCPGSKHGP